MGAAGQSAASAANPFSLRSQLLAATINAAVTHDVLAAEADRKRAMRKQYHLCETPWIVARREAVRGAIVAFLRSNGVSTAQTIAAGVGRHYTCVLLHIPALVKDGRVRIVRKNPPRTFEAL